MTGQEVFEELRFVWELMGANLLFLLPFAQRKGSWWREILGLLVFSVLSLGYFPLRAWMGTRLEIPDVVVGCWYICLTLLMMLYLRFCFELTICDALYICIAGYASQHIVYAVIHEIVALRHWTTLPQHLMLYASISAAASLLLYVVLYRLFAPKLRQCGGRLTKDSPLHILFYVVFLAAFMFCTFSCQFLFHFDSDIEMLSAELGILICIMILAIQYSTVRMILYDREQTEIQQMLRTGERNYALSRDLIEVINRSIHDLKHTLGALKMVDEGDRQQFIQETEQSIHQYQQLVYTDNEALNTILAEKSLLCDKQNIRFTCSLEQVKLDFLSLPDLYTLLGNAIDNAIESVSKLIDPEQRVISLSIQQHHAIVSIQTNNYFQGELQFYAGLPRTTKEDAFQHGYGLKSIRYLAEKYGGSMYVSARDQVFILQIMLPVQE